MAEIQDGIVVDDTSNTQHTGIHRFKGGSNFLIVDPTDSSKSVIFNLSSLPTATQTEFYVPDSDSTLVTLSGTQILTNKTLLDTSTTFANTASQTKAFQFLASGITAGQTRVFTVPDYDATLATLAGTETLTNKTLTGQIIDGGGAATNSGIAGSSALSFGSDLTEGVHFRVLEETVDLTDAGAKFVALTNTIPSGAVILASQANAETAITAGGTSVKYALGLNGGDVDKYGLSSGLTQDSKANLISDWAVLSGAEQIDVCAVTTDGSALGDSNFSAGSVRVRILFIELTNLNDAA